MAGIGNHDVVVGPPQKPHAPLGFGRTRPSAARHSSTGTVRSFKPSAEKVDRHIDIDPNKTGDEIRADMLRWLIERGIVIPEERRRSDWPYLAELIRGWGGCPWWLRLRGMGERSHSSEVHVAVR